jgi:hypothetical protein
MRRKMLAIVEALLKVVVLSRDRISQETGDGRWMLVQSLGSLLRGLFGSDWRSRRCQAAATEN